MSKIISIGPAVPMHRTAQSTILEFMQAAYRNDAVSRKLNVLFHHSGIGARYSVIPDFDQHNQQHRLFNDGSCTANVQNRLAIFQEQAMPLAIAAINKSFEKIHSQINTFGITHFISVTCTGLSAPGLDAELIATLKLPSDIFHTAVNFLGCNAAFHALKIADMIVNADKKAKVLILCVELCTLHFQPKDNRDNLLSNTIFGDGAAAVIITSDDFDTKGILIKGFYSLLLDKAKDFMKWNITPVNFEMVLDAEIPQIIGEEVHKIFLKGCEKLNIPPSSVTNWAMHPGGKKILDVIKHKLRLSDVDTQASYKILHEFGNMSSPTILFVLNELFQETKQGETIFSIGFGPGLSIETAFFAYE